MYNRVLNQAIWKAKRDYYQNLLTKYTHDLKENLEYIKYSSMSK